jgi:hypothetical protein
MESLTKKDLKEALEGVAKADDLVRVENKIERLTEAVNEKPDRDEFPELLEKVFEYATLKAELAGLATSRPKNYLHPFAFY